MADAGKAPVPRVGAHHDRWTWALIAVLATAALVLQRVTHGGEAQTPAAGRLGWLVLVLAFLVAEMCVVHITVRGEAVSFAFAEIPWVLGLFRVSPVQLIAARVLGGALALVWHRRQGLLKLAFNVAQCWLGAVVAMAVWRASLGGAACASMRGWLSAVASAVMIEVVAALTITAVLMLRGNQAGGLPLALGTGTAASAANACFALVAHDVMRVDWRGLWAVAVLAVFLGLAQRAHVTLLRRHDAMERLHAFTRNVGGSDLRVDTVVHEIVTGVRDLLEVKSVVLVHNELTWVCDADGVQSLPGIEAATPRPEAGPLGRGRRRVESLTVLLHSDRDALGSLTVSGRLGSVGGLRRSDLHLLEAAAGHAVVGLENGRLADELREQARANAHQAMHDSLTDLPNRLMFDQVAADVIATHPQTAVLLLDLDRFKEVNDTLGHAAGDAVLREVGRRLLGLLSDCACVARLGGDEFAVVLAGADLVAARACANRITDALAVPLAVLGVTLALDASIGIALSSSATNDVEDLLRQADVAMYEAKGSHEAVAVYCPDRDHNSAQRLSVAADLRAAIAQGELVLAYQPQAQTVGGAIGSVEALVRWQSPSRGLVPPDEFIGVAEQTGLIRPLTEWVLTTALRQCRQWMDEGLALNVAINVSPRTLHDPAFVPLLQGLLAEAAVPASRLVIEITESALMADPERAIDVLWQLRRAGVRLSVDDLGAGHSSLTYLKRLPVHEVKIDRSFVTHMVDDASDHAIVAAVIPLVHQLGMTVVAEGVEDQRTWDQLVELGADVVQGYWLSRPQSATDVTSWLRDRLDACDGTVIPMPRRSVAARA